MKIPDGAKHILTQLNNNGYNAYIVGGCVRDHLLGLEAQDYDITTSALPEDVKGIFSHTFDTGIEHGTITVLIDHIGYEVTTYRIDGEYKDNRHPEDVVFTDRLSGDLSRRDFTMNAIAYNPQKGYVDLFGGIGDIENKLIKGVGEPSKRFREDALRMLRAIRFSAQLDFNIEPNTFNAIIKNASLISNISTERIRDEVVKLLLSENPDKLILLKETGLMDYFLPCLVKILEDRDIIPFLLKTPRNIVIRLSLLFKSLEKKEVQGLLKDLKLDNKTTSQVSTLVAHYNHKIDTDAYVIRKLLSEIGTEAFENLIILKSITEPSDEYVKILDIYNNIISNGDCYSLKTLALNGNDLMKIGIKGKDIGENLVKALDYVLKNSEKNQKEILIDLIKKEI